MRKTLLLCVMLMLASLLMAACGGGDEPTPTPAPIATEAAAAAPVAQAAAPAGDVKDGEKIFAQTCVACHGVDAKGVQGLGKDLTTSTFVAELDDLALVDFLKKGRDPSDPLNTTGVAMPPKAGNPAFTDQQMLNVVAYMRTIHQQ